MKEKISVKELEKLFNEPIDWDLVKKDNSYYCDVLDVICDLYLTEKYAKNISEENTYFERKNEEVFIDYEFKED